MKLPALFQHYNAHHDDPADDDHDISFLGFLEKHYSENDNTTGASKTGHENLPFKSVGCHCMATVVMLPQLANNAAQVSIPSAGKIKVYRYAQHYSSAHLDNIWQPPRLV